MTGIKITTEEFYQLFGLCLASIKLEEKRITLADAWCEIVGEENRDRFWDFYDLGDLTIKSLKEKLEFDKIIIIPKKKRKKLK